VTASHIGCVVSQASTSYEELSQTGTASHSASLGFEESEPQALKVKPAAKKTIFDKKIFMTGTFI